MVGCKSLWSVIIVGLHIVLRIIAALFLALVTKGPDGQTTHLLPRDWGAIPLQGATWIERFAVDLDAGEVRRGAILQSTCREVGATATHSGQCERGATC